MKASWDKGAPACFVGFGPTGVQHYRSSMPAAALGASQFIRNHQDLSVISKIGVMEEPVLIYSMPFEDFQLAECAQVLEAGQKLIVDVDDYLRSLIGKDDIVQSNPFTLESVGRHEEVLKKATLVTTSNEWLANKLRDTLGVECVFCPNALDMDRFNIRRLPRRKDLTVVGWSGAAGHADALLQTIIPAMSEVLDARDDVLFCLIGDPVAGGKDVAELFNEDARERVHTIPFSPLYKHAGVISQFHITLAPTLDNDFYRAKSDIRYLEASGAYSAVVASETTYGPEIRHASKLMGQPAGVVVDADPDAWVSAIMGLIADPKGRDRMSRVARKYVNQYRTME